MSFFSYAWDWVTTSANWHGSDNIPQQILAQLGYSALPLLIAALIAVPIGVVIGHTGRGAVVVVNLANAWLAIPPILVNVAEGVAGVDADVKDAAKGMGMTPWQQAIRVEVPIAMPLILVGLRTSAIFVVATATIAAYIGLGGLGRYIIDGLASSQYGPVAGGALLVVILAVLVLALFALLSRLAVPAGLRGQTQRDQ
jgi:osmoprotectant transport system permease protein